MNSMHGRFENVYEQDNGIIIVCYKVGFYEQPPQEVKDAESRLVEMLSGQQVKSDVSLIRAWNGGVVFHRPRSRLVNPNTTDAMIDEAKADALERFPGYRVASSWRNASNGIEGVSVQLKKN